MAAPRKAPLARMKEIHKDKETLVDRVLGVIDLGGRAKDELKSKLLAASNRKLLRLLAVGEEIKDKYGSPTELAEALAKAAGKAKDQAYLAKLTKLAQKSPARALDMMRAAAQRHKREAGRAA